MAGKNVAGIEIIINDVRLVWPQAFEAKAVKDGDKPRFTCSALMKPTHPGVTAIKQAMAKLANEKWGEAGPATLKTLAASNLLALHNGDTKAEVSEEFAGNVYLSAARSLKKGPPKVVGTKAGTDGKPLPLQAIDGKLYSGCYGNIKVKIWPQDDPGMPKRINAELIALQVTRDGDPIGGGGPATADGFEAVEGAGEETADSVFDV